MQILNTSELLTLKVASWDFPGGPMVKTPGFQWTGCGFNPWSGNLRFHLLCPVAKNVSCEFHLIKKVCLCLIIVTKYHNPMRVKEMQKERFPTFSRFNSIIPD